jgi:hypothetical protein
MANQFLASIYRINANDLKTILGTTSVPAAEGILQSFPSQGVRIYPVQGTVTANGVTMASIIALLPSGLVQPEKQFYSPSSVSTLVTAANA